MSEEESLSVDDQIAELCVKYQHKPSLFVRAMYPWGEAGTDLEKEYGPDTWQEDVMHVIEEYFASGRNETETLQIAVASGRGIGKGALAAWITQWFISCFSRPQIIVTASSGPQLNTKTWRELSLWQKLALNGHWFTWTATKYYLNGEQSTWFASAFTSNEDKPDSFQGMHAPHSLVIFDEASGIADNIWEVTEGSFTDPNSIWLVLGNPTQPTGRFAECFGKYKHRWHTFQIDSRTCKRPQRNIKKLNQMVEDYGEDDDMVRVHVRGLFPRRGSLQFIGSEAVSNAMRREIPDKHVAYAPIVIGADIAREGDDQTVFMVRRGLKVIGMEKYRIDDTMQIASLLMQAERKWNADAVFLDEGGVGGGVLDRGRQLGHRWIGVKFGERATDVRMYANRRAEIWGRMKDWLPDADIPNLPELEADLTGPQYGHTKHEQILLERKKDMKDRGLASPDLGDALALTFAERFGARFEQDEDEDSFRQGRREPDSVTGY